MQKLIYAYNERSSSTQSKFEQESDKRVYLRGHSEHSIFNSTLNNLVSVISSHAKDPAQGLSIRLCEIPLYARDDTTIPQHSTLNPKLPL